MGDGDYSWGCSPHIRLGAIFTPRYIIYVLSYLSSYTQHKSHLVYVIYVTPFTF